uniref:HECT and RLD domain containing E3 ubiquitin protein ligase 3 n=1 Tax=Gadus morhua TaxID=8049 RepID=A0A8C5BRH2_GADMO
MLCWGNAVSGQLGIGEEQSPVCEPRDSQAFGGKGPQEVACGGEHSLFLLQDGRVFTCGSNSSGQLGHDKLGASPEPVQTLDTQKITGVSCGRDHSVALNAQGQVFSWGAGAGGQLGLGTAEEAVRIPRLIRKLCEHRISQIMCGNQHCIALSRDGQLFTWGQNTNGQLGLGKGEPSSLTPQPLKSLAGIPLAQISAGGDHSFALSLSGAVFGWGKNSAGQLGLNDEQDRAVPCHIKVLRSQKVVYISCGDEHTAALTKDGGLFTFGEGSRGQLGHDSVHNEPLPRRVLELMGSEVSQIACGRCHTLAYVPSSGMVYAFGCNMHGQLGTGTQQDARSPAPLQRSLLIGRSNRTGDHVTRYLCYFVIDIILLFSSTACWNASFLDQRSVNTSSVSGTTSGNMSQALLKTHTQTSDAFIQATKSLESLLIPQLPSSPPDVEAMRIYLILSECPALQDTSNYISLSIPLAMAILRLDPNPSKVLDNWWCLLDDGVFARLVDTYKSIVVYLLTGGKTLLIPVFHESYITPGSSLRSSGRSHVLGSCILERVSWKSSVTLCAYPFILNAQAKTTMLQTDAELQMQMAVSGANLQNVFMLITLEPLLARNPFLVLHVRRDHLVSDALRELTIYSDVDLKKPLKVIFDGEEAVDAGGVTKEFFLLLLKELMDPVYGMFTHYPESNLLWFSDKCFVEHNWFHLIGIICGLAIYNSTVVDLHFPLVLYKKLLAVPPSLDDLKELSPTEGRSLQQLLDHDGDDVEEVFCLNFAITRENYGLTEVMELIPGGEDISVDQSNRKEFVEAYLCYVFSGSVSELYSAFSAGFLKVCGGNILSLFQPTELMAMVVGNDNYNWEEMEKNAVYKGEYSATHPTVRIFWEVFHDFPLEKKKQFLLFLTGSDRIPIHGMASLRIALQSTTAQQHYLPVAHTCYNLLDLPQYLTKDTLRRRLTQAIEQYEGFSLV